MRWENLNFSFAAEDTSKDVYMEDIASGFARIVKIKLPNFADTPTATLNIYDAEGDLLYTKGSIAENAVTIVSDSIIPVCPGGKVNLTLTGAAGSALDAEVTFFII